MANVLVLTGASEKADGDLPRLLYTNDLATATLTPSSTASGSSSAYLVDDRLDRAWQSTSATTHTITATFATSETVSAAAIHGHNIGSFAGNTALVEAVLSSGGGWVTLVAGVALTGSRTFYRAFTAVEVDQLRFTITTTAASEIAIAALACGLDFECERGLQAGWSDPLTGRMPTTRPATSRNGTPLPSTITDATVSQTFALSNCSQDWMFDYWFPFQRACDGGAKPCFLSWGPSTYPDRACYCSGIKFSGTEFSQKGFVDVGFQARMDAETGWVQS